MTATPPSVQLLRPPDAVWWLLETVLDPAGCSDPSDGWWELEADQLVAGGLAGAALDAAAARGVVIPAGVRAALGARATVDALARIAVEALAAPIVEALEAGGVVATVIKGPGIRWPGGSHRRPFSDLDVLVAPAEFRRAMGLLRRVGGRPTNAARSRRYFDRWCYEATEVVTEDGAGIDLHHHVPPWRWGAQLTAGRIAGAASRQQVATGALLVASPVHNLLVATLHVLADRTHPGHTPKTWLDVAALAATCDPGQVVTEATACGIAAATRYVFSSLPPSRVVHDLVAELPPEMGEAERRRLSFMLPGGLGAHHHIGQAARLPVVNAVAFLVGEAFPSARSRRAKPGQPDSLTSWWASSLRALRAAR